MTSRPGSPSLPGQRRPSAGQPEGRGFPARIASRLTFDAWPSPGATYTRYADDLTFSGPARIGPILRDAVPAILRGEGFAPNPAKTRLMPAQGAQIVTGVMVNRHVNLPRAEFDRLKAVLHHLARPDDPRRQDAGFLAALSGRIGWVEQINPARGAKLRARLVALTG